MSRLKITWTWKLKGQLHIGTGIGRVGYADDICRRDNNHRPFIPGDAVKGAIREAAERLLLWLDPPSGPHTQPPPTSYPAHPILETLFAPPPGSPFYRFSPGRIKGAPRAMRPASTAIDNAKGVADDTTLRVLETVPPDQSFTVSITVEGVDGEIKGSTKMAILFLLAAIVSTETVGGKKGIGHGEFAVENLVCTLDKKDILGKLLPHNSWTKELIEDLQSHVRKLKEGWQP